jgi:hypothetical protein
MISYRFLTEREREMSSGNRELPYSLRHGWHQYILIWVDPYYVSISLKLLQVSLGAQTGHQKA